MLRGELRHHANHASVDALSWLIGATLKLIYSLKPFEMLPWPWPWPWTLTSRFHVVDTFFLQDSWIHKFHLHISHSFFNHYALSQQSAESSSVSVLDTQTKHQEGWLYGILASGHPCFFLHIQPSPCTTCCSAITHSRPTHKAQLRGNWNTGGKTLLAHGKGHHEKPCFPFWSNPSICHITDQSFRYKAVPPIEHIPEYLAVPSVESAPTANSATETRNFLILNGKLVVICDFLIHVNVSFRIDYNFLLSIYSDDLCIAVGLKRQKIYLIVVWGQYHGIRIAIQQECFQYLGKI